MTKQNLRKPTDLLFTQKGEIEKQLTQFNDRFILLQEQLNELRGEQSGLREAKETLSNTNTNKPAKVAFDKRISEIQLIINAKLKELDTVEKDRIAVTSRLKAIEKSIKELQNA
jgi:small-conductance mechanosensitive channel